MTLLEKPRLRLFIGAALISLSPVWVTLVDVAPTVSGFYRVFFGALALAVFLLATRRRLLLSQQSLRLLILTAFFLVLVLWFWHRSIIYIGPGLATLLGNFQVFILMAAGFYFFKESPTRAQLLAVPLALFGLALIVGLDWKSLPGDYKLGVVLGLLNALAYALYLLTLRKSCEGSSFRMPIRELAIVSVVGAAMLALVVFAEGESLVIPSVEDLGWLVAYGVLSHCIGWLFIASSLSEVTSVEAGLALLLQPALSFGWDVLIFDRPTTTVEITGAGIALAAIYLGSRPASKQLKDARQDA